MKLNGTEEVFKELTKQGYSLFWGSNFVDLVDMRTGLYSYVGSIYQDGKYKPCKGFPVVLVETFGLVKVGNSGYNFNK